MKRIVKYLGLILIILSAIKGLAQDRCELTLTQALEEFNAGHFYTIPYLLKDCLDKNDNAEWRQRAFLLLAETYLLLDDPFGADESYLRVLRANPEYETDPNRDPIDLVYLSKKFTSSPVFSLYGKVGPNTSPVHKIHDVRIGGEGTTTEQYKLKVGWHAGLGVDYNYNSRVSFSIEGNYSLATYKHETKKLFADGDNFLELNASQSWFTFPLLIKYSYDKRILRPYGYAGYSVNLLMRDRGTMLANGLKESPVFDFMNKRNTFNSSLIIGGGLKYKWKLNYFFADLRYGFGLTNVVDPDRRYDGVNQRWAYVDDDFRIDNLSASFGYIHPFYKPRKLKKAKTKSVLRRMKKKENEDN